MARNKMKNSKTVSFRLRNDICDKLEKCSEETMLSKTAIVEKALEDYFNKPQKEVSLIHVGDEFL